MTYNRRICEFTNTPISLVDPASVQLSFADLDENGRIIPGKLTILDCCGDIRRSGEVDLFLTKKLDEMQELNKI